MGDLLQRRFAPDHYIQELLMRLYTLHQCNKSIAKDIQEFEVLLVCSKNVEMPEQSIARFIVGLWYEITNVVEL